MTGFDTIRAESAPGVRVYRVFGGRLASEVELPGVEESSAGEAGPDWTLRRDEGTTAGTAAPEIVAEEDVQPGVRVLLLRAGEDLRLAFDDTGAFDVSRDGARIRWRPGPDPSPDDVRLDVLGRVMPLALHRQGKLTFHASAAATGHGAVAFLGPKGAGKSTVAMGLARLGAPILSDDAVPVEGGDPPRALAGTGRLRIRPDVARATGHGPRDPHPPGRRVEIDVDRGAAPDSPVPLAAMYLLAPVEAGEAGEAREAGVRRERLDGPEATAAVLGQLKLGSLLCPWQAPELLQACAAIVESVPVYRLELVRDLDRLEELGRFVAEAHGGLAPARAG